MKVAVISDIHLGRGDQSDHFGQEDGRFIRFLDFLEDNFERIILLGDIYETITSPRYGAQEKELYACFNAHREITERFIYSGRYEYIHGNHDLISAVALGARQEFILQENGLRILFTHGHIYDFLAFHLRRLAEFFVWLGGHINRVGLDMIYDYFAAVDTSILGASKNARRCRFQRWALDMAYSRDADLIVTGHTHQGRCSTHGDKVFMNSGACINGVFQFLSIDTATASFAYHNSW